VLPECWAHICARLTTLRRRAATAAQILLLAAILWFVWRAINWEKFSQAARGLEPDWPLIVVSAVIVFSTYLLLIATWRGLMHDWGTNVRFVTSMRIWFVSVLGRYVPGRIWSAAAVALMAKRAGASPLVATGAALLLTLINTIVGACVLIAIGGPQLLRTATQMPDTAAYSWLPALAVLLSLGILLLLPTYIGPLARFASRIAKREFHPPPLALTSVLRSAVACAAAWILYGIAFWIFCIGLFGGIGGSPIDYVKVYTGSYLAGYVFIVAPGGVGAREGIMVLLLPLFTPLSAEQAALAAVSSRVWLTVLEVLPGAILMLFGLGMEPKVTAPGSAGEGVTQGGASHQKQP
jgi:uncharacterized membrane protein YbhN (UPF0104 family)